MQFTEPLEIRDAQIVRVGVKNNEDGFETSIQIRGWLTPGLAEILGLRSIVYADNDTPREGFSLIEDSSAGCPSFRAVFEVEGLSQSLEITGEKTDMVSVEKEGGILWLKMRLKYSGDPLSFFGYWVQVGSASGRCKVVPLQKELDFEVEKAADAQAEESPDRSHENRPKGGRRGRKAAPHTSDSWIDNASDLYNAEDGGDPVQEPEPEGVVI